MDIDTYLESQIKALEGFHQGLMEEKHCLENSDYDRYPTILKKKESFAQTIAKDNQSFLPENANSEQVQAFIDEQLAQEPSLRSQREQHWSTVVELFAQCEHHNEVNARLLQAAVQFNARLLDMLTGRTQDTYSKEAKPESQVDSTATRKV